MAMLVHRSANGFWTNKNGGGWKMIFLFNLVIFRFQPSNFPGCTFLFIPNSHLLAILKGNNYVQAVWMFEYLLHLFLWWYGCLGSMVERASLLTKNCGHQPWNDETTRLISENANFSCDLNWFNSVVLTVFYKTVVPFLCFDQGQYGFA